MNHDESAKLEPGDIPPIEPPKTAKPPVMKKIHEVWAEHLAACPGPYRINEACNSKHNEAWRAWARKKMELQERLSIADQEETKSEYRNWNECRHTTPERFSTPGEKTPLEYYRAYMQSLKHMESLPPRSTEWRKERSRAYNLRNRLFDKYENEKDCPYTVPKLPEVPKNDNSSEIQQER